MPLRTARLNFLRLAHAVFCCGSPFFKNLLNGIGQRLLVSTFIFTVFRRRHSRLANFSSKKVWTQSRFVYYTELCTRNSLKYCKSSVKHCTSKTMPGYCTFSSVIKLTYSVISINGTVFYQYRILYIRLLNLYISVSYTVGGANIIYTYVTDIA